MMMMMMVMMMMMMTNIHKMTMIMHQVRQARQQHTDEEDSDWVEDNCDGDGDDDEHTQDHNDYDYGVGEVAAH